MKKLRRQILIREYDYTNLVRKYVPRFYDTATFEPISLTELEREQLFELLKKQDVGSKISTDDLSMDLSYPRNYLFGMKHRLHNPDYVKWYSHYDSDGHMWIQARKNTPASMLGWATFEYHYE